MKTDVLSRLIADREPEDFVIAAIREEERVCRNFMDNCDAAMPVSFAEIGRATNNDADLQKVKEYTIQGWPVSSKAIKSGEVAKFFPRKDSLSLIDDVLLFRDRTIIPPPLRQRVLAHLHATHPGTTRMKSLARSYVYWPGLNNEIEELVGQCQPCMEMAKAPVKTELSSWPVPVGPWQRVHADYMGPLSDKMYLVIVDAFSKWPEVFQMTSTTASATVDKLAECCSRFGSMITLVTDNAPNFVSSVVEEFCSLNNINHLTSPAYHPQSNGQAEAFVGHLKRTLKKDQGGDAFYLHRFLQNYRATRGPHTPTGESPAELLLGRIIRLPLAAALPPPKRPEERNKLMESAFNKRHGAVPRNFEEGERVSVRMAPNSKWRSGLIIESVGSVMYNVLVNGRLLRAHANQIRNTEWALPFDVQVDVPAATTKSPRQNPNELRGIHRRFFARGIATLEFGGEMLWSCQQAE